MAEVDSEEHSMAETPKMSVDGNDASTMADSPDVQSPQDEESHNGQHSRVPSQHTMKELPPPPPEDDVLSPKTVSSSTPSQGELPPASRPDSAAPDHSTPPSSRPRTNTTDSQSTSATGPGGKAPARSSMVFVISALETIAASKDARKRKPLAEATQRALATIKGEGGNTQFDPELIFQPLELATEANATPVVTTALDCIGKLISYSYFSLTPSSSSEDKQPTPLIERAIDTICDCFQGEATPVDVQLQIVKSLLAAILNDKIVVHGAGLLKAIRQTYNIFLLSKSSANQQIAQGTLTQMVGTVFERVKTRISAKELRMNNSRASLSRDAVDGSDPSSSIVQSPPPVDVSNGDLEDVETVPDSQNQTPVEKDQQEKITLQSFENRKSFDDDRIQDSAPTMVTRIKHNRAAARSASGNDIPAIHVQGESFETTEEDDEDEIYIRDAFLVFRAMCKLSTKPLPLDQAVDAKSHGMRSKLLALHILYTILFNHSLVFTSPFGTIRASSNSEPTSFVQAIKQYLCLSLSRNGASSYLRIFEVSCEIFWLTVKYMRVALKKEIEVFLKEIYLAILDKKSAPTHQKHYIVCILGRIAGDARALVEIYLNYDCDRTALDNMFQKIIENLSRIAVTPIPITHMQHQAFVENHVRPGSGNDWQSRGTLPSSLTTSNVSGAQDLDQGYPLEYGMKQESLEYLVDALRSLAHWAEQNMEQSAAMVREPESRNSLEEPGETPETRGAVPLPSPKIGGSDTPVDTGTPIVEDDPSELERVKQRKTALTNGIKQFNFKPKRGVKQLIKDGFIATDSADEIARFLLDEPRLSKAGLGEYLGEGDPENVAIMHAFVDQMDFNKTRFVDALRRFLQSFRLPGEAQKIDRFMLKFAERYIAGNPNAFANADTAYVLAYSVIMLNTDQHSAQVKARMTPEDFIKNNRGINDDADLPEDYLRGIFEEIANNEIVLDTEREAAANLGLSNAQPTQGLVANIGQALATAGRDLRREAYVQASEEMANKTEQLYRNLLRAQKRGAARNATSRFIPATSFKHVGPMFETTWMSFLLPLSGQAQETDSIERIQLCMEGQRLAIRLACLFDLEDPRQAFVSSLARFTNLYNLSEMKAKNLEALKMLLEVALQEGNLLKESWREILTAISQLDRFQLISTGVDEGVLPDVLKPQRQNTTQPPSRRTTLGPKPRSRNVSGSVFQTQIAEESRSADMIKSVDRIFTNTANLNGDAIVHFVKALTQVSWQEIESSGSSESPRTYSLQKIVEISGYNMTRVRFEWTNIWQVLGEHFIQVGCHGNTNVVFFALNSLRQLSMRFMDIEELPGFSFQKDFLKPFEHIISNATVVPVKDMVLRCLIQMIQAKGDNIRSGWRTMFGVFTVAAKEHYESIVNLSFENVTKIYDTRFGIVISQGAFADLVVCLTEFSKNMKFQKKSLQAIETLKSSVPKMLRTPECPLSEHSGLEKEASTASGLPKQPSRQTQEEQFWFPVLFAFHDVLMTGEDLEVRSRALNYLFETLVRYGGSFPRDFWDTLWRQLLYPIFMVLKSKSEMSKVVNHEELSVWLSTTMIQALRNMINLFTHFFTSLSYMLDRFLDLLALCICQENDTLARIGSNCLQQLILQNVTKFTPEHWNKIVTAFVDLFNRTEASALFSAATSSSLRAPSISSVNGIRESPEDGDEQTQVELTLAESPSDERMSSPLPNALGINGLLNESEVNGATAEEYAELEAKKPSGPSRRSSSTTRHRRADSELEDYHPDASVQQAPVVVTAARRRFFNQIITKCVLQLLMIETVNELFSNESVYTSIPSAELLRLMALLKKSYHFAKKFNGDRELRTRLFREGFMKQPPNLLKQESGSAAVYVSILLRMFHDPRPERLSSRPQTEQALIPLCVDIITSYIALDEETQQRNIATWRPVVIDVLEGYTGFPEPEFTKHIPVFAPLTVGLLGRLDLGPDLQRALQSLLARIFEVKLGVTFNPAQTPMLQTPTSPRVNVFGSRRGSRVQRS